MTEQELRIGNILTNSENVKKSIRYDYNERGIPDNFTTQTIKPDTQTHPF